MKEIIKFIGEINYRQKRKNKKSIKQNYFKRLAKSTKRYEILVNIVGNLGEMDKSSELLNYQTNSGKIKSV